MNLTWWTCVNHIKFCTMLCAIFNRISLDKLKRIVFLRLNINAYNIKASAVITDGSAACPAK